MIPGTGHTCSQDVRTQHRPIRRGLVAEAPLRMALASGAASYDLLFSAFQMLIVRRFGSDEGTDRTSARFVIMAAWGVCKE